MRHDYKKPTNYILASRCSVYLNRQLKKIKKYRTSIASKHFFTCALLKIKFIFYCCPLSGPVYEIKQKNCEILLPYSAKSPAINRETGVEGRFLQSAITSLQLDAVYCVYDRQTDPGPVRTVLYFTGYRIRIKLSFRRGLRS